MEQKQQVIAGIYDWEIENERKIEIEVEREVERQREWQREREEI